MTDKMKDIIIEEIIQRKVKKIGNSSHILLPKKYRDRNVYVLVLFENLTKPKIHKNKKKTINGKIYYHAEITNNAGTHSLWIEKDKIP